MECSWGNVVSWIIVFAGWFIVDRQNNARETRKEIRSSLLDLYRILDTIEDLAIKYHTSPTRDPSLERSIKRELAQVPARIGLALRSKLKCNYTKDLTKFRQAVTLDNFETTSFLQKEHSDPMLDGIVGAKQRLILTLEKAYTSSFKN